MSILKIIQNGDKILRQICEEVDLSNEKENIAILINDMIETVSFKKGVGLAAPQVNIAKRVIVVKDLDTNEFKEMINPEITWTSFDKQYEFEGCLSILGKDNLPIHERIGRYKRIRVKWQDIKGNNYEELIKNPLQSRIIQHEIDHLNGKLFIDYLNN